MSCWADQIDHAMKRGGSPYTALDVLRWLREGIATLWIWPNMHASAVVLDGVVHIGHVWGRWLLDEAQELWDQLGAFCQRFGRVGGKVQGRAGWQRFLRMRGFTT